MRPLKTLAFQTLGFLPDALYLRIRYRQRVGIWPDLGSPRRFSEKLQWLKLHDRQPIMTRLADKMQFKEFVVGRFGPEYVIPVLAAGVTPSELSESIVPAQPFVLKTNHDSGGVFVITNPESVEISKLRGWVEGRITENCYLPNREWEYRDIKPRWFIEPLLGDDSGALRLNDFKIHCFHGSPRFIQTIFDRDAKAKENWFDLAWNPVDIGYFSRVRATVAEPICLEEMLSLSSAISAPFPYARVDFYVRSGQPLLGEITFRPYGGFMRWQSDETDFMLGKLLHLGA